MEILERKYKTRNALQFFSLVKDQFVCATGKCNHFFKNSLYIHEKKVAISFFQTTGGNVADLIYFVELKKSSGRGRKLLSQK